MRGEEGVPFLLPVQLIDPLLAILSAMEAVDQDRLGEAGLLEQQLEENLVESYQAYRAFSGLLLAQLALNADCDVSDVIATLRAAVTAGRPASRGESERFQESLQRTVDEVKRQVAELRADLERGLE